MFAKRHLPNEAQIRILCLTDDDVEKTLEFQEQFQEIARSRDVEVSSACRNDAISNFILFYRMVSY